MSEPGASGTWTADTIAIDCVMQSHQEAFDELRTMKATGVTLANDGDAEDDQARLITDNRPRVARPPRTRHGKAISPARSSP